MRKITAQWLINGTICFQSKVCVDFSPQWIAGSFAFEVSHRRLHSW